MILVKANTNELFLDGVIGADWFGEGITAKAVGEALTSISGHATIRINSPGGSADEGVAIYNLLRRHADGVTTVNEALAASAASVVFLAGDRRIMERGSRLMIHRAHTVAIGNTAEMLKMAEVLSKYDDSLASIYAEHMDENEEAILAAMDAETWYNAEEAIESGLATEMTATLRKKSAAAAAWFRHPPTDLFDEPNKEALDERVVKSAMARKQQEILTRLRQI